MMKNRRLAQAVADAGMAGFLTTLKYKCTWYGAEFVKADRGFPSSRLCTLCGWHNRELSLSDRSWWCGSCGALNERDTNAAKNLESWPSSSFSASGRGDRVSPAMPAVVCEASMSLLSAAGLDYVRSCRLGQVFDSGTGNALPAPGAARPRRQSMHYRRKRSRLRIQAKMWRISFRDRRTRRSWSLAGPSLPHAGPQVLAQARSSGW